MPIEAHRDAELAGGQDLVELLELLQHFVHSRLAVLGERFEAPATGAHERELGRNEQAVEQHEEQQRN